VDEAFEAMEAAQTASEAAAESLLAVKAAPASGQGLTLVRFPAQLEHYFCATPVHFPLT